MKFKILRFPDGKTAVTSGLKVEVNKSLPNLEENLETDDKTYKRMLERPRNLKFSKRSVKIYRDSKHSL